MRNKDSLSFLTELTLDPADQLRTVWWLLSSFDSPIWHVSLNYKTPEPLDWRIQLDDQSLLTDQKNHKLLTSLKYFLASSTENSFQKNFTRGSDAAQRQSFNAAIQVIDSLLINSDRFELARYGLPGINENHLKQILENYASTNSTADSVYDFTNKATKFCLQLVNDTPTEILQNLILFKPEISEVSISVLEESKFAFPILLIPSIRAALIHHNFFQGYGAAGFHVNTKRLAEAIYKNTLRKQVGRARIHVLSYFPQECAYRRELPGAPVRNDENEGITNGAYCVFRRKLFSLGYLHALNVDAPPHAELQKIENHLVEVVSNQRFKLVPSEIIFEQFKNCIEFHLKYGRIIMNGYCRLAKHCKMTGMSMAAFTNAEVKKILGHELTSIGVKQLGLVCRNQSAADGTGQTPRKPQKKNFYLKLRANHGFIELFDIYVGCAQFVVGVLMARRASELIDLPILGCLDKTLEWLIIDIAKTSKGLWGVRDKQARPIDKLGTRIIRELQRVQRYLKKIGFITDYASLFSTPNQMDAMSLLPASTFSFLRNFDLLFDYFETPLNADGQRYYIRQHQLRRFFALLFFHFFDGNRINGIRWHLGHADIAHVWHYITEVIDGACLRGAKSQYIVEKMMKDKHTSYKNLAEYLESKYGIADFMLVDAEEADAYIQDEMKNGNITVEPEFFEDENGTYMKVIVKITHHKS
jgi:hypothetical protein